MPRPANVVDQAINLMEKIEKTRTTAIKELLALRGQIDSQLGKLGYVGIATQVPAATQRRLSAYPVAKAPRRVVSAETRLKMLKAQQERRKREKQAKLAAQKSSKKQSKTKKAPSRPVKAAAQTTNTSQT